MNFVTGPVIRLPRKPQLFFISTNSRHCEISPLCGVMLKQTHTRYCACHLNMCLLRFSPMLPRDLHKLRYVWLHLAAIQIHVVGRTQGRFRNILSLKACLPHFSNLQLNGPASVVAAGCETFCGAHFVISFKSCPVLSFLVALLARFHL